MNEDNGEPQVNNLPPTDFNAPKSNISKLAISIGGILIALLVIGFFVYKNYYPQNLSSGENQQNTSVNSIEDVIPKDGFSRCGYGNKFSISANSFST